MFNPKIIDKRWSPELEEKIIEKWIREKTYLFDKNTHNKIFSIDTPPPYASGKWHLGGAIHYSQIDMIARVKRMLGFEVLFPLGIDRNGLPIEVQTEKEYNIRMRATPREKFIELCRSLLDKYEREIINIAKRLGLSSNSFIDNSIYRTDSPEYRRITQATFIELWSKGLIYTDTRANNWCPVCGTTLADAEIEYTEMDTNLNHIIFKVKETGESIVIATTRPELLPACAVVMVNPDDTRYTHLPGKTAVTPLFNIEVPIIAHPAAQIEFGTGIVMTCSYGDYTDVRLFRELNLTPINVINPDGTLNEKAGPYQKLTVQEARERIVEDLKKHGLIIKVERIKHRTPICWRSKNPIEFIQMPEYYLKQSEYREQLLEVAEKIKWYPPHYKQILIDWLNSISMDWPISRRRYYGTEIPIWYCNNCGEPYIPPPGEYYQPWCQPPPVKKCPRCGSEKGFKGEERTFDTWFDSGISQLQILYYLRDSEFFKKAFPCSIRPQGKDIIRTWLYYSLLRTYQLLSKPAFESVWISGMVLDEHGRAMHKSLGNIVWVEPLLKKYGADALRLFGCLEASLGSDIRFSEERLSGAYKFLTKLWNIARFISTFPYINNIDNLEAADKWILLKLNELIKTAITGYEKLDFQPAATSIRSFTWDLFASHYLELVKSRCYNRDSTFTKQQQQAAWYTIHRCLNTILKLLAPICPFITEQIYTQIYAPTESIHHQKLPTPDPKISEQIKEDKTELITQFNKAIWAFKNKYNIPLNAPIANVYAPKEISEYSEDLKKMHSIQNLQYGKPASEETFTPLENTPEEKHVKTYIKINANNITQEKIYIENNF
ncbi:MAG: valine--tRNA ligase [Candidatus Odinarchaeum yellowstonii]|uniref:Valine--tRNA ligase n=1 Tax=Odinarchaeota yellowstonii (strain LCB_4) TaxID=1841599 RepID=A0AAF0D1B3_ODILC|nr:MAG: valine--tRNA ligase [Candidatus Odinarchaeum yellowstonii]